MTNLEFLEETLENGDYESQKISRWAILQFNKNNIGLLNERQKESLANIGQPKKSRRTIKSSSISFFSLDFLIYVLLTKKDIHYGNEFLCSNPGKEKG
jgi:hypothetical protein